MIAVPGLVHDSSGGAGSTSSLAVANGIGVAGHTDVAVGLFDANGLTATRCWRLKAGETVYADATRLGLAEGFKGSVVISAVDWTHTTTTGSTRRRIVGLTAALVRSARDQAGADTAHVAGVPLLGSGGALTEALSCSGALEPTPTPPTPTVTPRRPGVYLPNLEVPPRATVDRVDRTRYGRRPDNPASADAGRY